MNVKVGVGLGLTVVALAAIAAGVAFLPRLSADGVASAVGTKKVTLKVQLPAGEKVTLSVDGKEIEGTGDKREVPLETDKEKITVTAKWDPNGYTTISRTRKVDVQAVIDLDLSKADDKMKDDITVIFVPTPEDVVDEMCKLAKITKDDVVYDLGCGDGRMVIQAVKNFGAKKGVGVDLEAERVKDSKERAVKFGVEKKVEFRQGDVLKIDDLPDANVVLLYMGEYINLRLRPILKEKLKPGSRIVSHRFTMGDWTPTRQVEFRGADGHTYTLLLWVIGEEAKKK